MFRIKEVCRRDASEKPCTLTDTQSPSCGALLSGAQNAALQMSRKGGGGGGAELHAAGIKAANWWRRRRRGQIDACTGEL